MMSVHSFIDLRQQFISNVSLSLSYIHSFFEALIHPSLQPSIYSFQRTFILSIHHFRFTKTNWFQCSPSEWLNAEWKGSELILTFEMSSPTTSKPQHFRTNVKLTLRRQQWFPENKLTSWHDFRRNVEKNLNFLMGPVLGGTWEENKENSRKVRR